MGDECCAKVKNGFDHVYQRLKSLTGSIIVLVLYNIIGAVIFVQLEAPYEREEVTVAKITFDSQHADLIRFLNRVTTTLNNTEYEALKNDTESFISQYKADINQTDHTIVWTFWKALFFCGTIYTTIGYGNIYPKTDIGKVVVIFYAVFGIPLAMKVLAEIGKKLTVILKFFYFHIKRCYRKMRRQEKTKYNVQDIQTDDVATVELNVNGTDEIKTQQQQEAKSEEHELELATSEKHELEHDDTDDNLPVILPVVIFVMYIFLGGLMYTCWEDWGYLDSFYFVFISISTIGFGDFTPAHTKYFIVTSVYVFIGLSLVSMCINVLIELYIFSLNVAVHKMDIVKSRVKKGCVCGIRRQSI